MDKKEPPKSPNKRHSLKQIVEGTSEKSKVKANERILSSEETSSEESVNAELQIHPAQLNSGTTIGGNSRKDAFEKLEMEKIKQSSQSLKEKNFWGKNSQSISKPIKSSKGKVCKRPLSSEQTSSDELVKADESQIQISQLHSHTKVGESQKEVLRKQEREKIMLSLKLPKKLNSSGKNRVNTLSSKLKANKKIFSKKETSNESVNANKIQIQNEQTYSRSTSGENYQKEAYEKTERKKQPSESPVKKHSWKKKDERISRPIESNKGKVCKRSLSSVTNSDELINANESQIQSSQMYSHATVKGKSRKEEPKKLEVGKLRLTLNLQEKENLLKKNVEETTNSKVKAERKFSSEETFSDESVNINESQIQNKQIYSHVTVEGKNQKEVPSNLEVREIRLTIKLQETQNSSKNNIEETSNSKVKDERIFSSKKTSSNELANTEKFQIQSPKIYCKVYVEGKKQKEVSKEVEKSLTLKLHEKQDSSKKNVEVSSSNKVKVDDRIFSTEETTSDELVDVEFPIQRTQIHSGPIKGEKSRIKDFDDSEMKKIKPSSKSPKKKLLWKKKFRKISKPIECSKGKVCKRPLSSEKTSSDEMLNAEESKIQSFKKCSHVAGGRKSRKKVTRESEVEKKRPTLKLPGKQHSSKKNETSISIKSSKGEENKEISCKQGFSGKFVNDKQSQIRHDHTYSTFFSKKSSHEKASRILRRSRPSSCKSPKRLISISTADKPLLRTRSSKMGTQTRINYCEDSSPDELLNDDMTRNDSNSATLRNERCNEASSSRTMFNKNKIERGQNVLFDFKDSSSDDLRIDVVGSDTRDISDTDEFLNKSTNSSTLSQHRDVSKSRNLSPFLFWGKNIEKIRHSENCEQKDRLEVEDNTCSRNDSKQTRKDDVNKEWEKFKSLMMHDKKDRSRSKTDNAEPGSSSEYQTRDDLQSINEISNSEGDIGSTEVNREIEDDALSQNAEKVLRNDKKDSEKFNHTNEENFKEMGCSTNEENESETSSFHNERQDGFKLIKPIIDSEGNLEYKKDGTEGEACVQSSPVLVNYDNVRKESEIFKSPNKNLDTKETSMSEIVDAEPGNPLHYEKRNLKPTNFKNDTTPKNDGIEIEDSICGSIAPKLVKEENKTSSSLKLEKNVLNSSKVEDANKELPTYEESNENIDLKYSPLTSENKGALKRRSDPSNALKENRPRPSF